MNWRSLLQAPVVASVLMHLMLLLAVAYGWEASKNPAPHVYKPHFVKAKLVTLKAQDTDKPAASKHKVIDLTKKRELERQRAEANKRAKAQAAKRRAKARAERQRKKAEAQKKAEAERKKQAELAKKRAAEQARKKAEQQRQEKMAQERLTEALKKEDSQRQAQQDAQRTNSYMETMANRIEQNWSRPPSARRGMECTLLIQLVPTGQVVNVTVAKSSGNAAFDRSAKQAVRKVERFTELQKMSPELFEKNFRQLYLKFKPEDLRL